MTKTLFAYTTAEVCAAVGMCASTLKALRRQGVLTAGRHYRYAGIGQVRPRLRWNLQAVEEALTMRSRRLKVGQA